MNNKFNQQPTESQVNDMAAAFNPFGWLDLRAAVTEAINAGYDADWAAEQVQEFAESCGMSIDRCDPVYCVMSSILQEARNEIDNITGFDIQNDACFDVYGNFMASSWDIDEDGKTELIAKLAENEVNLEDLSDCTQYWIYEQGITQEDINNYNPESE